MASAFLIIGIIFLLAIVAFLVYYFLIRRKPPTTTVLWYPNPKAPYQYTYDAAANFCNNNQSTLATTADLANLGKVDFCSWGWVTGSVPRQALITQSPTQCQVPNIGVNVRDRPLDSLSGVWCKGPAPPATLQAATWPIPA